MIMYLQMLETSEEQIRFEDLVHTYKNLMFYVANQILNNDHDAEDAVQQAFFAILKNFEKISEIKCPQTRSFVVTVVESLVNHTVGKGAVADNADNVVVLAVKHVCAGDTESYGKCASRVACGEGVVLAFTSCGKA